MIVISPALVDGVEISGQVVLFNATWGDIDGGPSSNNASVSFKNDGTVEGTAISESGPDGWTWLLSGSASDFQIRAKPTSGSVDSSSSAVNSWLGLGTTRTWYMKRSPWNDTVVLSISIRDSATQTVRGTCTITLFDN